MTIATIAVATLTTAPLTWTHDDVDTPLSTVLDCGDGRAITAWVDGRTTFLVRGFWSDTEGRFEARPCSMCTADEIIEAAAGLNSLALAWLVGHAANAAITRLAPDWRHPASAEHVAALEAVAPVDDPRTGPLIAGLHDLQRLAAERRPAFDPAWDAALQAAREAAAAWLQPAASTVWVVDYVEGGVLEAEVVREAADVVVVRFGDGTRLAGVHDELAPGDVFSTREEAIEVSQVLARKRADRAASAA